MACPTAVLFQVKYTNRMFHGLTRPWGGKMYDFRPGLRREGVEEGLRRCTKGRLERPVRLWIGSSARRAFGGCLGSKRR
jgi:hypothetical protein